MYASALALGATTSAKASYSSDIGYCALNKGSDALSQQMVKMGGASDSSGGMSSLITSGAGVAGGAICAAYGAAAASPACAAVSSAIVRVIIGGFSGKTSASGAKSDYEIFVADWNTNIEKVREAQNGALGIRAYLTARDALLDQCAGLMSHMAKVDAYRWANHWLWQRGAPPAPIIEAWRPNPDLWDTFTKTWLWAASAPINTLPYAQALDTKPVPPFTTTGPTWSAWAASIYDKKCAFIKSVSNGPQGSLSCEQGLMLLTYPGGPLAPPGEPIDLGIVGLWQIAAAYKNGTTSQQLRVKFVPGEGDYFALFSGERYKLPSGVKIPSVSTQMIPSAPHTAVHPPGYLSNTIVGSGTPNKAPRFTAVQLTIALAELRPEILKAAGQQAGSAEKQAEAKLMAAQAEKLKGEILAAAGSRQRSAMLLAGFMILGAGGYAAWRIYQRRR